MTTFFPLPVPTSFGKKNCSMAINYWFYIKNCLWVTSVVCSVSVTVLFCLYNLFCFFLIWSLLILLQDFVSFLLSFCHLFFMHVDWDFFNEICKMGYFFTSHTLQLEKLPLAPQRWGDLREAGAQNQHCCCVLPILVSLLLHIRNHSLAMLKSPLNQIY